tara:strand:- start:9939 stop:10955 length:1017 start_codon:yes stop_codon:yes gene_type:complete
MKISQDNLSSELNRELFKFYLVSGDEYLLVQESIELIRSAAKKEDFFSREIYYQNDNFDWNDILASSSNLSLFSEKKIIEIKLSTLRLGRSGSQSIINLIEGCGDELMIIVSSPKLDRAAQSSKWVKLFQSDGGSLQIWPIQGDRLKAWLRIRMKKEGLIADRDAIGVLANRVEGNLLAASQAIEKLKLLLEDNHVNEDDIQKVIADNSRYSVFQLIDETMKGNLKLGLKILSQNKNEDKEAFLIIAAITRELRSLSRIANSIENGVSRSYAYRNNGVWDSRKGIVNSCLSRHNTSDFLRMIKLCLNADNVAKGQKKGEVWQLITNIIIDLASHNLEA